MPSPSTEAAFRQLDALLRLGPVSGLTDGELLDRFVAGPGPAASSAFAALVERHGAMVLRACRRELGDPHDAEDAAQATFLALARAARSIRRRDSAASWLFGTALRVARHAQVDAARRHRHERTKAALIAPYYVDRPPDPARDLLDELARLPERHRAPLVLCHLEGLTNEQAAATLRLPLRTVQRRLADGREALRARLLRRGVALTAGLFASEASASPLPIGLASSIARLAFPLAARAAARSTLKLAAAALLAGVGVLGLLPSAHGQKPELPPTPAPALAAKSAEGGGRVLRLQVVDGATGRPIPRASVMRSRILGDEWLTADDAGRIDLRHSTGPSDRGLSIDVCGDGHALQRHFWGDGGVPIPDDATIRLNPGESLGGIVRDEQGQPVAGALVYLWSHNYKARKIEGAIELMYNLRAITGPDGRWRTTSAPETTGELLGFRLVHPDYLSDRGYGDRALAIPKIADLRAGTAVSVLKKGAAVEGRVVDADGKPVAGAMVLSMTNRESFYSDALEFSARSGPDGRFRLPQAEAGKPLCVVAKAPGHAPGESTVSVGVPGPIEVRLGRPRALSGRVTDTAGRPIPGAFVDIDYWRGYRCLGVYPYTDEAGKFRWDDAPNESIIVNISMRGYNGTSNQRVEADGPVLDLVLRRVLSITGKIRDAETGKRAEDCAIEYGPVDPKTGEVSWHPSDTNVWASSGDLRATLDAEKPAIYRLRIKAKGYEPVTSHDFRSDAGEVKYDVTLRRSQEAKGAVIAGTVLGPDGRALAGASVVLAGPPPEVFDLVDGRIVDRQGQTHVTTDVQGRFRLAATDLDESPHYTIVVAHEHSYAEVARNAFEADRTIRTQPWGRAEGVVRIGPRPAAGLEVHYFSDQLGNAGVPGVSGRGTRTTDAEGRFAFDRVAPGDVRFTLRYGTPVDDRGGSYGGLAEVKPGETARVTLGGVGRPVVGRVVPPDGFDPRADYASHSEYSIESDRPTIPYPKEILAARDGRLIEWVKRWWASPEGKAYRRTLVSVSQLRLNPDLTFRAEDIPAGDYVIKAILSADPIHGRGAGPDRIAHLTRQFRVPATPGGRADEPLDLGTLRPRVKATLKVGETAPGFSIKALDGKPLKLGDYRGKFVLLDFWATWCGPCVAELPNLKSVHERFGKDDRFVLIGLSLDANAEVARRFVASRGVGWVQGFLGNWSETEVPDAYHVEAIPATFLIGPDGKVVARDLRGDAIEAAVAAALRWRAGE